MKVATNPIEGWPEEQLRLHSVAEACRILGSVGKTWLYSEIAAGKLKPLKLGARTMFTSRELNRYIAARESEQST